MRIVFLSLSVLLFVSCGRPAFDPSDAVGKQAILDDVNNKLTSGDCANAVSEILPLYNSANSDNTVRQITASAYGCSAGINFFDVLASVVNDSATVGANFWGFFSQLFPSTAADKVVESAGYGMDVLLTVVPTGEIIAPSNVMGAGTFNPGSLKATDRQTDSNIYMLLMSMSAMGSPLSRNGNATFHPTNAAIPLPWNDNLTHMDYQGCTFAAGLMNFLDVLPVVENLVSPSSAAVFSQINTVINLGLSASLGKACDYGCKGTLPAGADILTLNTRGSWVATGCSLASGCNGSGGCPSSLKDMNQCHANVTNDPAACAAAGIINFMNSSGAGWI